MLHCQNVNCNEPVEECDWCCEEFGMKDNIICMQTQHFCQEDCFLKARIETYVE